jgi:hypothetical protein
MKAWQIFTVGTIAAVLLFSLHAYESALAGIMALAMLGTVLTGFCLCPRRDVYCLRTTIRVRHLDAAAAEHDRIAVKVELARLWLLFIPAFASVAFLVGTAAEGTTWEINLFQSHALDWFNIGSTYPVLLFFRFLVIAVFGLLSAWLTERWILREADACSASSFHISGKRILYGFQEPAGGYYGGHGFPYGATRSFQLRTIVFYMPGKPQFNKITMCCLFHRVVIVGRGVTDFDEATAAAVLKTHPETQPV